MPDTSDLPRFPGPDRDPDRLPPRRGWSPVAAGLTAAAAVAGLFAAVTRALFFGVWFCLALLVVKRFGGWVEDDGPPPRDD
jgi:hypothetical protein